MNPAPSSDAERCPMPTLPWPSSVRRQLAVGPKNAPLPTNPAGSPQLAATGALCLCVLTGDHGPWFPAAHAPDARSRRHNVRAGSAAPPPAGPPDWLPTFASHRLGGRVAPPLPPPAASARHHSTRPAAMPRTATGMPAAARNEQHSASCPHGRPAIQRGPHAGSQGTCRPSTGIQPFLPHVRRRCT